MNGRDVQCWQQKMAVLNTMASCHRQRHVPPLQTTGLQHNSDSAALQQGVPPASAEVGLHELVSRQQQFSEGLEEISMMLRLFLQESAADAAGAENGDILPTKSDNERRVDRGAGAGVVAGSLLEDRRAGKIADGVAAARSAGTTNNGIFEAGGTFNTPGRLAATGGAEGSGNITGRTATSGNITGRTATSGNITGRTATFEQEGKAASGIAAAADAEAAASNIDCNMADCSLPLCMSRSVTKNTVASHRGQSRWRGTDRRCCV